MYYVAIVIQAIKTECFFPSDKIFMPASSNNVYKYELLLKVRTV